MGPSRGRCPARRCSPVPGTREWRSTRLPRYQRRLREVNEAVVATYLAGGNTRRLRGALSPLLHHRPAGDAAVALYGRGGSAPELIVVTRDAIGRLSSASWALRPTEDPGRAESAPRQVARAAAGAVDVGTAPVQWLLLLLGVVRIH